MTRMAQVCLVALLGLYILKFAFARDESGTCTRASDESVREELERLMSEYGMKRPTRSAIDETRPWRFGVPNYDSSDLLYMKGRTRNHSSDSLESVAENLVKTWEMEASHLNYKDWRTVDHDKYRISANGGKWSVGETAASGGNYNALLQGVVREELYASNHTFETSHELFRDAFPTGFAWELLEVMTGPPRVVFSWRHWAYFTGAYRGRPGDGKLYEMFGMASTSVDENLRITDIEVYYKPEDFLQALQGELDADVLRHGGSIFGGSSIVPNAGGSHYGSASCLSNSAT